MNENIKVRSGNILVRINNIYYEVPDCLLIKGPSKQDVYLSGIVRKEINSFKFKTFAIVKHIVENRLEFVPYELFENFLNNEFKKIVIDDEEYDIPYYKFYDLKAQLNKLHYRDIRSLNKIKEENKEYLFKNN